MLQLCYAAKLQKCFVDFKTSPDFPSTWERLHKDWTFDFWRNFSFNTQSPIIGSLSRVHWKRPLPVAPLVISISSSPICCWLCQWQFAQCVFSTIARWHSGEQRLTRVPENRFLRSPLFFSRKSSSPTQHVVCFWSPVEEYVKRQRHWVLLWN